jgi:hypothetical protein
MGSATTAKISVSCRTLKGLLIQFFRGADNGDQEFDSYIVALESRVGLH